MTFSPGIRTGRNRSIFEAFTKVIAVCITYFGRNLRNFVSGIRKQLFGFFHAVFRQILIESLASFTFEKGAYVGSGKIYMAADILYGKGIIHVIPADVILDHKDGGIFRLGIPCIFKILSGFFFQRFMKLFVGKSIVQGVHDQILFFVKPGFYLIFFSGRGKRIKQLIIKITDLVGHKCVITAVIPEKFLKKLNTVCFLSGKEVFGKSIFRRLQGIRNRSFWGKLFYGVFCKKCFSGKKKQFCKRITAEA